LNHNSTKQHIPVADPRGDLQALRERILTAITEVIDSGSYILGKEVSILEAELAARLGTPGAVGVGSGTEALVLGLLAAGVGPGDEVITVSHTAGATVAAIHMIGAIPVLVDVCEDTLCTRARSILQSAFVRRQFCQFISMVIPQTSHRLVLLQAVAASQRLRTVRRRKRPRSIIAPSVLSVRSDTLASIRLSRSALLAMADW
jgi:hypothetical protein